MNDAPSDYLRDRHTRVATPREVLDDLVRRATGSGIRDLERIIRGYDNEVYRVRTDDDQEVAVRLRRFGEEERSPEGEAWAIERARDAGAPAPTVMFAGSVDLDDGTFPVLVLEWLPGVPLARLEQELTVEQRDTVLERTGAAFAAINSVRVAGLWLPPEDGDWTAMTWDRVIPGYVAARLSERDDALAGGLTPDEFDRTLALIGRGAEVFRCEQPVLCHNDMNPEHVLVDDDLRVTGVVDFGNWCGASDVGDLGMLHFSRPDLPLAPVLRGYGPPLAADPTVVTRIRLQALMQAIGHVTHHVREGDDAQVEQAVGTLRSLIRSLRDWMSG